MKRNELTMDERLAMMASINKTAAEFLEHATDEDFKAMFSGCRSVAFPDGNTTQNIIDGFAEPFKSIARLDKFAFDYRLNSGKSDHDYLSGLGYDLFMGGDCSYYVAGLDNLSATSYGDWGTVWKNAEEEQVGGVNKSFYIFCRMYNEGIVFLWRARFYIGKVEYRYMADGNRWVKYENRMWVDCDNPL